MCVKELLQEAGTKVFSQSYHLKVYLGLAIDLVVVVAVVLLFLAWVFSH